MFYRYYEKTSFPHRIHFETEEELDQFSYEVESDNPNYYLMRRSYGCVSKFFKDNNMIDGKDYDVNFYDYEIKFKNKNDAMKFKLCFGGKT